MCPHFVIFSALVLTRNNSYNDIAYVRFEVLMALTTEITVFYDVILSR
jgi:hypothetical protein